MSIVHRFYLTSQFEFEIVQNLLHMIHILLLNLWSDSYPTLQVIQQKLEITYDDITNELCPVSSLSFPSIQACIICLVPTYVDPWKADSYANAITSLVSLDFMDFHAFSCIEESNILSLISSIYLFRY